MVLLRKIKKLCDNTTTTTTTTTNNNNNNNNNNNGNYCYYCYYYSNKYSVTYNNGYDNTRVMIVIVMIKAI